jgi:hypothetical protein
LSYDEVAGILSEALGRKIVYVKCDRQEMRQLLLDNALSEDAADLVLEMYDAIETGRLRPSQSRSAGTTTPTTLAEFAHEVMLPMLAHPVAGLHQIRIRRIVFGQQDVQIHFVHDRVPKLVSMRLLLRQFHDGQPEVFDRFDDVQKLFEVHGLRDIAVGV